MWQVLGRTLTVVGAVLEGRKACARHVFLHDAEYP